MGPDAQAEGSYIKHESPLACDDRAGRWGWEIENVGLWARGKLSELSHSKSMDQPMNLRILNMSPDFQLL